MTNEGFLKVLTNSFNAFIDAGTSRSTEKLKPLHGAIACDLAYRLGGDFSVCSQGYADDREGIMQGRYIDKRVDITVLCGSEPVAGVAVKFVMQNYSQNSNNYFENMLGETANIRCNHFPYFQIFIILDKLPYYNRERQIKKWETFTDNYVSKYLTLSEDDVESYFHTPNKTLIYVVHVPDNEDLTTLEDYMRYYRSLTDCQITLSASDFGRFGQAVIVNDYEKFAQKVYHTINAL